MLKVGKKIRILREIREYTQGYMAEHLRMSQSNYSKLEKDETELTLDRLVHICDILDVTLGNLINIEIRIGYKPKEKQPEIRKRSLTTNEREHYEERIGLLEELLMSYMKKIDS
jgi:transcriptional regulator with XRE-family HTH domain